MRAFHVLKIVKMGPNCAKYLILEMHEDDSLPLFRTNASFFSWMKEVFFLNIFKNMGLPLSLIITFRKSILPRCS